MIDQTSKKFPNFISLFIMDIHYYAIDSHTIPI